MNNNFSIDNQGSNNLLKPRLKYLFGLIFIGIGIMLLRLDFSSIKIYNTKNEVFIETTSKVISCNRNEHGLKSIVVEYVVDGKTYQKESKSYFNSSRNIGTEVLLKYNPKNPKESILFLDTIYIYLQVFAVCFIVGGILLMIKNGRILYKRRIADVLKFASEQENGKYNDVSKQ